MYKITASTLVQIRYLLFFVTLTGSLFVVQRNVFAQNYPAVFDPAALDGTNGFEIPGINSSSALGTEVRFVGDINGDGLEDLAIGNGNETVNGNDLSGRVYVLFGSNVAFPSSFDLTMLDGNNGFTIEGTASDERRGYTLAGPGDINGDGFDDLIVTGKIFAGGDMVIYGTNSFPAVMTVNDINGNNGFLLVPHNFGTSVGSAQLDRAGDVNGDGINDFILGVRSEESWIIFGRTNNFPSVVDINYMDGTKGFRTSSFEGSRPAYKVGGAGDINNDGYDDILIGNWASSFDPPEEQISYAVFGKSTPFSPIVDVTSFDGTDGFKIDNRDNGSLTYVGALGDINGDGIDDCYSENNIILGSTTPFPDYLLMSNLNGSNGFVIQDYVHCSAPAGDLNFDGIDDFITIGNIGGFNQISIVYGKNTSFNTPLDLGLLDGTNGFKIENIYASNIGRPIDGGKDFNGDGLSDFVFGNTSTSSGQVYIVFGGDHNIDPCSTDNANPVISCPSTQTVSCGNTLPDYTSLATVSDNCDSSPGISQSPVMGSLVTNGMIVTLTATDGTGNTASCNFTVNVNDNVPPTFDACPGNQLLNSGQTLPGYTSMATISDNCDNNPNIIQTPPIGTLFTSEILVSLVASDQAGNTSTCTFTVSPIVDTEPPVLSCPSGTNLTCGSPLPDYRLAATVSDDMDSDPTITQNPMPGTMITQAEAITITASDEAGNTSTCTFQVGATPIGIDIGQDIVIRKGESIELNNSLPAGNYLWSPSNGLSDVAIKNPVAKPEQTTTYFLDFTDENGCSATDQITLTVIQNGIQYKYALSPNNDGNNDTWIIEGIEDFPQNQISVFNRWGNLVFSMSGYNNREKSFNGKANHLTQWGANKLPDGTYFFSILKSPGEEPINGFIVIKN